MQPEVSCSRFANTPTSRVAAKVGNITVDIFAVKSSWNLVKKAYIVDALLAT
jgi:hypothetical protein